MIRRHTGVVPTLLLLLATLTTGLTTGAYALSAHTVMPGLGRADDRTVVSAFQALDRAIVTPWFMAPGSLGAPDLMAAATATYLSGGQRPVLRWPVVALVLDLVTVAITVAVNVPRNDRLKATGGADAVDAVAVRAELGERTWACWTSSGCSSGWPHSPAWPGPSSPPAGSGGTRSLDTRAEPHRPPGGPRWWTSHHEALAERAAYPR